MRFKVHLALAVVAAISQGCLAPYKFAKDEKTARLQSLGNAPSICVDGKAYSAPREKNLKHYLVPADRRVTVFDSITVDSYPYTFVCVAHISLLPIAGETYIYDVGSSGNRCRIDMVRMSQVGVNGVERIPTLGPSTCVR